MEWRGYPYYQQINVARMTSSQAKRAALVTVAPQRGGNFTAQRVLDAGYAYTCQHYHVRTGNRERATCGIFRLRDYPLPEREDLIVLSLLSYDYAGQPHAIFSHGTALALHDLRDTHPSRIHLTAPPGFRRQLPNGVVIHRGVDPPDDWEERDGYRVITPLRTLLDIATSPTNWSSLEFAARDALRRRLVQRRQLLAADLPPDAQAWLLAATHAAERHDQKAGA